MYYRVNMSIDGHSKTNDIDNLIINIKIRIKHNTT